MVLNHNCSHIILEACSRCASELGPTDQGIWYGLGHIGGILAWEGGKMVAKPEGWTAASTGKVEDLENEKEKL